MNTKSVSVDGKTYQLDPSIERTPEAIYVRLNVLLGGVTVAACKLRCWRYEPGYDRVAQMSDVDVLQLAMRFGDSEENVRSWLNLQAAVSSQNLNSAVVPVRMALLPENYQPENLGWAR
jgi:hypothetical protein